MSAKLAVSNKGAVLVMFIAFAPEEKLNCGFQLIAMSPKVPGRGLNWDDGSKFVSKGASKAKLVLPYEPVDALSMLGLVCADCGERLSRFGIGGVCKVVEYGLD